MESEWYFNRTFTRQISHKLKSLIKRVNIHDVKTKLPSPSLLRLCPFWSCPGLGHSLPPALGFPVCSLHQSFCPCWKSVFRQQGLPSVLVFFLYLKPMHRHTVWSSLETGNKSLGRVNGYHSLCNTRITWCHLIHETFQDTNAGGEPSKCKCNLDLKCLNGGRVWGGRPVTPSQPKHLKLKDSTHYKGKPGLEN